MRIYREVIAAFGIGAVLTALTGLIAQTPSGLVGPRWYGFPFRWIERAVVAPGNNPWGMDYTGLIFDIGVWFLVAFIVLFVVTSGWKRSK